jgi:hypothetical protein
MTSTLDPESTLDEMDPLRAQWAELSISDSPSEYLAFPSVAIWDINWPVEMLQQCIGQLTHFKLQIRLAPCILRKSPLAEYFIPCTDSIAVGSSQLNRQLK